VAVQAIIYSKATGRVRRVVDPQVNVPNVIAFLAQAGAQTGEAVLIYTKQGQDTLTAWQAAVNAHTGLSPDITQTDWCCGVDAQNNIAAWFIGDPACNDGYAGLTTLFAPWGADSSWTYNGTFIAPIIVKGA